MKRKSWKITLEELNNPLKFRKFSISIVSEILGKIEELGLTVETIHEVKDYFGHVYSEEENLTEAQLGYIDSFDSIVYEVMEQWVMKTIMEDYKVSSEEAQKITNFEFGNIDFSDWGSLVIKLTEFTVSITKHK